MDMAWLPFNLVHAQQESLKMSAESPSSFPTYLGNAHSPSFSLPAARVPRRAW